MSKLKTAVETMTYEARRDFETMIESGDYPALRRWLVDTLCEAARKREAANRRQREYNARVRAGQGTVDVT